MKKLIVIMILFSAVLYSQTENEKKEDDIFYIQMQHIMRQTIKLIFEHVTLGNWDKLYLMTKEIDEKKKMILPVVSTEGQKDSFLDYYRFVNTMNSFSVDRSENIEERALYLLEIVNKSFSREANLIKQKYGIN